MSSRATLVDVCLAAALAAATLILAPGLAVVGLIAVFVIVVCAISFGVQAVMRRRHRRGAGRGR
jgi:hypothetical protein